MAQPRTDRQPAPEKVDHLARIRPGNKILRVLERLQREREEAERA